jgi:lipopolysaccharide/colanic/teichoic acid biosynthesis glycosyltransferase
MVDGGVAPRFGRRLLDVAVALTALVLLSPLLLTIALLVRLASPGPALFRQTRVGQGGQPFTIYKFRSMRLGSGGPEVTTGADPRVTRIGRIIRATSLDELPQLVNVLHGEMTLVGPRPETPRLAARYPNSCTAIFRYRPGLTGPAQTRMRDGAMLPEQVDDLEEHYLRELVPLRVELDFDYLRRPTLARTLLLLAETGAYVLKVGRRAPKPASRAADHSAR